MKKKKSVKMMQSQTECLHRPNLKTFEGKLSMSNPPQNFQVWKYMDYF